MERGCDPFRIVFWLTFFSGGVASLNPRLLLLGCLQHLSHFGYDFLKCSKGTWTLAVLPDTQGYQRYSPTDDYSGVFLRQTEWIAAHRDSHNILFVAHLGDITDNNLPEQWENARRAMQVLNRAKVPYALLPGNHDIGEGVKTTDRSTLMNDYFKPSDYGNSEAAGFFEEGKLDNNWHEFSTPIGKFLLVAMEFGPRDAVLEWANKVVAERPGRKVIVTTHAHIYPDSTRHDLEKYGETRLWNPKVYPFIEYSSDVNDGEEAEDQQLVLC